MFLPQVSNKNKGISVIEILIVIAVIGIAFSSILGVATLSLRQVGDTDLEARAQALAKETLEAVMNYRDGNAWDTDDPLDLYDGLGIVQLNTSYYPKMSSDIPAKWQLLQGQEQVENFTRTVEFQSVSRDSNSDIVQTGGTVDSNTKKVLAAVSWQDRGSSRQVSLQMYITNWKEYE
ncbi:MAG: type II secretion system protein [Candidatus Wildermuthbacteria bacterium]|nr:type II secretion system protein [Candidatus Wildermuthbacteria bacterium]